jgi:hypothetical protein
MLEEVQLLQLKSLTESWNGTNWTEVNDLNTPRRFCKWWWNCNTSALKPFGGRNPSDSNLTVCCLQNLGMELTGLMNKI